MAGGGSPQCMRRRSIYPMDDGRSVEIVMTSCSSAGRREQECMILLISVVRDANLADGSAGAIRG